MQNTFDVHITREQGDLFLGPAYEVTIPTTAGYITVLPNHVPLVAVLASGTITVRHEGGDASFPAERGVVDVRPHAVIVLLHHA